ncbi:fimbrillin family protein [Segatella copri]
MKKAFYMMAAAAIALSSCSSEETTDVAKSTAISFRPTVGFNSRGAELNNTNFSEMWVSGFDMGAATGVGNGFEDVKFNKQGTGNEFLPDIPLFWQAGSELRFFAINPAKANWHGTLTFTKDAAKLTDVTIPENIEEQKDLVIGSVTAQANNHMDGKGVDLTLNHILSQINFKAVNTNKRLTYHIAAIRIVNAKNSDTYSYNAGTKVGSWAGNTTGKVTYELNFKDNPIVLDGTKKTDGATEADNYDRTTAFLTHEGHGAMLVPQALTPWNGAEVSGTAPFDEGSYIALLVNVCFTNGTYVYPKKANGNEDYGWIAIPLPKNNAGGDKSEWKMGNKYIYTLNLSEGCGKVDPVNPNPDGGKVEPGTSDPDKGANIFGKPIKFTVTLAPWTDNPAGGNGTNIQM